MKSSKSIYTVLTSLALISIVIFGAWWFSPSHIPNNFTGLASLLDVILFLLVTYVVWHPIMMNVLGWAIASNIKDIPHKKAAKGLRVAFITTFVPASESVDLLHRTLPAMKSAKYEHDTWLLDEGGSEEVRQICIKYGVKYFSRYGRANYNTQGGKFAQKTKGGNHNSWYDSHGNSYDIVAQIDTDFVPKSNFLTKTLGYFKDPRVAFVGTPQIYANVANSFIARGAAQQTYNFYGPILRGLYGMDSTLLIGANHVIRVNALKSVGHYSAHITEDLLTGMKLHADGWKSVYVHEALALGEGPSTWSAYFNQQMRWAYGCIDILFRHSPSLFKKMNLRQKVYYFFLQQHYFSGLAMMLSVLGLSIYFVFGLQTAVMQLDTLIGLYAPVILFSLIVDLWLQKFYVRPKQERGFHLAGKIISIASWPIFFLALFAVIRKKRLTYKVTPKGIDLPYESEKLESPRLFLPHIIIGLVCLAELISSFYTHRSSGIMIFWASLSCLLLLSIPFTLQIIASIVRAEHTLSNFLNRTIDKRQSAPQRLPDAPTDSEKYSYFGPRYRWAFLWIMVGAMGIIYGFVMVLVKSPATIPLLLLLLIMLPPILVNFWLRIRKPRISKEAHIAKVREWREAERPSYPSVDIFLPSCGEDFNVLRNTFNYVSRLEWPGVLKIYVLDDAALKTVEELAEEFRFEYIVRPNRGELKKAGNLINAFENTDGDFMVVFDADFVPRPDFLFETIPYMDEDSVGVVQTAQYFDISKDIGWMERYAGTLQEIFFRWIQPARDTFEAAICAGTNVIYRREAVAAAGGFARAPIGEDVHSGVKIWTANYKTRYIPLALAKGLAPDNFNALANQQYRWCRSSMLLMINKHFKDAPFSIAQRLSFWAAFLYYMSSAALVFTGPLPTLIMLWFYPSGIHPGNYLPMIPSIGATLFVFPMLARGWYPTIYKQCMINSFCHLLAITHALRGHVAAWVPTGAAKKRAGIPQIVKRIMISWILSTQILLWAGVLHDLPGRGINLFWPTIILGVVQLVMLSPLLLIDYDVGAFRSRVAENVTLSLLSFIGVVKRLFSRAPKPEYDV